MNLKNVSFLQKTHKNGAKIKILLSMFCTLLDEIKITTDFIIFSYNIWIMIKQQFFFFLNLGLAIKPLSLEIPTSLT